MAEFERDGFSRYLLTQWTQAGADVSEPSDAPYKELVKHSPAGFSLGYAVVHREGGPYEKARVGVWFRQKGKGSPADFSALRGHYQNKIQQQGRGCRIQSCELPVGTVYLFFETTNPLPESAVPAWVAFAETLTQATFDADALDELLGPA